MKDDSLAVIKTKLQDLGWGMPSTEEAKVMFHDGFMEFFPENKAIPELRFRVSHINSPILILGKNSIPLESFVKDGELLIFSVSTERYLNMLLEGETNVFQEKAKS